MKHKITQSLKVRKGDDNNAAFDPNLHILICSHAQGHCCTHGLAYVGNCWLKERKHLTRGHPSAGSVHNRERWNYFSADAYPPSLADKYFRIYLIISPRFAPHLFLAKGWLHRNTFFGRLENQILISLKSKTRICTFYDAKLRTVILNLLLGLHELLCLNLVGVRCSSSIMNFSRMWLEVTWCILRSKFVLTHSSLLLIVVQRQWRVVKSFPKAIQKFQCFFSEKNPEFLIELHKPHKKSISQRKMYF